MRVMFYVNKGDIQLKEHRLLYIWEQKIIVVLGWDGFSIRNMEYGSLSSILIICILILIA